MLLKIAILDSGIKKDHPAFYDSKINGFSLCINDDGNVERNDDFDDHIGHGTAIYYLINSQYNSAEIYNIRIIDLESCLNQEDIEKILQYIYEHFDFDIINISMGFVQCGNVTNLQNICNKLHEKGTIIVSAFDNDGAVSFPAALDNVVGVDSQDIQNLKNNYIYVENSIVNIVGKRHSMRVAWINPDYIFVNGSSFVCANVTVQIARQITEKGYFDINTLCDQAYYFKKKLEHKVPFNIKKAAVFPFNKEIHAIARFEDMLDFEVTDYYSTRITGQVGKTISDILPNCNNYKIVKNIDAINWDQFDTLILGHNEMLSILSGKDVGGSITDIAVKKGKNIYCFDPPETFFAHEKIPSNLYCPMYTEDFFVKRFGKLYRTDKPVLSIIGTNSRQGKFSLQLYLRRKLMKRGFSVGNMGTEPSSLLFGFDAVFPCGYNGMIQLDIPQTITAVNELIWDITQKDPDIIITGGQSGFLAYNDSNARMFPSYHQIVFSAIQTDAIILCINPYDDIEFIERTIKAAEALSNGKVIGIVCFPIDASEGWKGRMGAKTRITQQKELELKKRLYYKFCDNIGVYMLDNSLEIDALVESIICYFQ